MNKWELTRYLIEAKKCIDSLIYISLNICKLVNIKLREKAETIRRNFYINVCVVLDNSFPKDKKKICSNSKIIAHIYHERDKNSAHKDPTYIPREYNSWEDEIKDKKAELGFVRELCRNYLPNVVTLDYVPHDREMFRLVNAVTIDKEETIKRIKHSSYGQKMIGISFKTIKAFNDTEDIRTIPAEKRHEYGVLFEVGLNGYETQQNYQNDCIKFNVLCEQNFWIIPDPQNESIMEQLVANGFLDVFEIPILENWCNPSKQTQLERIMKGEVNE